MPNEKTTDAANSVSNSEAMDKSVGVNSEPVVTTGEAIEEFDLEEIEVIESKVFA